MAFYIAAAVIAGLLALPLEIKVDLDTARTPALRLRIALAGLTVHYSAHIRRDAGEYMYDFARDNARRRHSGKLSALKNGPLDLGQALAAAKAAGRALMRDISVRSLALRLRLGVGDAAASAMLSGFVGVLLTALFAVVGARPTVELQPDYTKATFALRVEGMFCINLGHIIGAGLTGIAEICKGALVKWKTRLRKARLRAS